MRLAFVVAVVLLSGFWAVVVSGSDPLSECEEALPPSKEDPGGGGGREEGDWLVGDAIQADILEPFQGQIFAVDKLIDLYVDSSESDHWTGPDPPETDRQMGKTFSWWVQDAEKEDAGEFLDDIQSVINNCACVFVAGIVPCGKTKAFLKWKKTDAQRLMTPCITRAPGTVRRWTMMMCGAGQNGLRRPKGIVPHVRGKDGKRLKDALARALARADAATRKRIEDVILAAAQSTSGAGAGGTGGGSAPAPSSTRPSTGAGSDVARVGGSGVVVYHPEYAKQMRKGGHAAAGDEGRVSMDHMWRRYRDNAVDALDNGQVPAEYRPIIRKFFDTEPR